METVYVAQTLLQPTSVVVNPNESVNANDVDTKESGNWSNIWE